jgi:phospholipase/carboxylesterase
MDIPNSALPHGNEPVAVTGNTSNPTKALVLLHGRGASAESILQLSNQLTISDEYVILAPQANQHTWYPERFIASTKENQPHLDSALERISAILMYLKDTFGIESQDLVLAGFSQGACLAAEFVKRNPARYGGIAVFSGGLIGDNNEVQQSVTGDLAQTAIYLGCDVEDFHIPKERVGQSADIFNSMNAVVNMQFYEGLGHSIHLEGVAALQGFITVS